MAPDRADAAPRIAGPARAARPRPGASVNGLVDCGPVARLQAIRRVVCDKRLSRADFVVFVVIVDRMNPNGEAWPGINTIAKDAAVNRSTATRAVAHLVQYGHLEKRSGTRTRSNRYRLGRCDAAPSCDAAPRHENAPRVGAGMGLAVGARTRPESASLNLNNEPVRPNPIESFPGSEAKAFTARRHEACPETETEKYTRLHDERMHALYAARCSTEEG